MSDTSTEAVERFTYSLHSLAQYEYLPDVDRDVYGEAINLIRALAAERDALRAEKEAAVAAAYEDAARLVETFGIPRDEFDFHNENPRPSLAKAIRDHAILEEKNDDE